MSGSNVKEMSINEKKGSHQAKTQAPQAVEPLGNVKFVPFKLQVFNPDNPQSCPLTTPVIPGLPDNDSTCRVFGKLAGRGA
jgi:hypothetical protein